MSDDKAKTLNSIFQIIGLEAICQSSLTAHQSTFYDIFLGENVTLRKFQGCLEDIGFRLNSKSKPHYELKPGGIVTLQIMNETTKPLNWFDSFPAGTEQSKFSVYLGMDYYDKPVFADFSQHSNHLIAGCPGSGKSQCLISIICNTLFLQKTELWLADPKGVEFCKFKKLDNVRKVVHSYEDHVTMLDQLIDIMEQRFALLNKSGKTNMNSMPWMNRIIVIMDEIADLIYADRKTHQFHDKLIKLSSKGRAAGIFLVIATQHPNVKVLSGQIKANFQARVALRTATKSDSRVILDESGAENLIGNGDALIKNSQGIKRFKAPYVSADQILNKAMELNRIKIL